MIYLSMIGIAIIIIGWIVSYTIVARRQLNKKDTTLSAATSRHWITANPGLIAYASIIVAAIVIIGYYMIKHS